MDLIPLNETNKVSKQNIIFWLNTFDDNNINIIMKLMTINTYYYNDDPNSVFGYKIYEYDELIGGYKSMAENDLFQQIIEKINIKI